MRYISCVFLFLAFFLFSTKLQAKDCVVDIFFQKNIQFNSHSLDIEESELNRSNNLKTMLPDVSIGLGQYINNNKRLSPFTESNFHLSLSHNLLSGYTAKKQNDKLEVSSHLKYIDLHSNRYDYIINLFSEIVSYRIKESQIKLMNKRYKKLHKEYEVAKYQFSLGTVSLFDVEIRYSTLQKIKADIESLEEEKFFLIEKISKEYNIPEDIIPNITYNQLKECKTIDFQTLLTESNKSKIKSIDIDDDIRNISRLPSLYVSFGLTPKKGGALSNISLKEMNYSASLGISFPLMGLFNSSENQRIKAISLSRTRNELLKDSIKLELLQKEIFQKLSTLKKNLAIVKNELSLKRKEVEYIKNKQDNVIDYLSVVEKLYETENEFKKIEYEIEYYSLYHYFLLQCNSCKGYM